MYKYLHYLLVFGSISLMGGVSVAYAEAPMSHTQVPGYYRMQLGEFEITALYDGAIELDSKLLRNVKPADLSSLLARMFVGNPKMQTAVNAYLVNTGSHLVLVDTGAAKLFGPSLGFMLQNLKASGYEPGQVDTIVTTHLHPDHMGGLNDVNGKPVFPRAKVYASSADNDYWLSQQLADAAPDNKKDFFTMARNTAAPYRENGQWNTFSYGSVIVPGIQAMKANGHTPGHTAYAIESDGQKLLIWGDLVHAHAVQFANPGVSIEFDVDHEQAIATRLRIMKAMANGKTLVAGMHLPFPGIGHVRADGNASYSWVPSEFSPMFSVAQQ